MARLGGSLSPAAAGLLTSRPGTGTPTVNDSRREVVRQDGARHMIGDKEAAGFPDLVLARDRVVYAELKSETGRLSKTQLKWLGALSDAGQESYVWRPSCWPEIERVLR